jgi:cytochrome c
MRNVLLTLTAAFLVTTTASRAQDLAAGAQSFKKCLACHAVGEGAANKVGPQLNGLEGRKSGTIPGYNYSEANKKADLVWDEAVFRNYIKNPMGKIPGTKMAFPGIRNETEITNLWAYLKQFGADGKIK